MPDFVRVADVETGHHVTITRSRYDRDPKLWRLLKQSATFADGSPRPAKHKTSVSAEAAKNTTPSGQSADTEKE